MNINIDIIQVKCVCWKRYHPVKSNITYTDAYLWGLGTMVWIWVNMVIIFAKLKSWVQQSFFIAWFRWRYGEILGRKPKTALFPVSLQICFTEKKVICGWLKLSEGALIIVFLQWPVYTVDLTLFLRMVERRNDSGEASGQDASPGQEVFSPGGVYYCCLYLLLANQMFQIPPFSNWIDLNKYAVVKCFGHSDFS